MIAAVIVVGYLVGGIVTAAALERHKPDSFRDFERIDRGFVVLLWPLFPVLFVGYLVVILLGRVVERAVGRR